MNEDRATRYHRLRRRARTASLAWHVVLLLGLLGTGAAVALRDLAARIARGAGPGPVPALAVAAFAAGLFLLQQVGSFPIAYYRDFALERRYGLSVEPAGRWLREHLKARAVALALVLLASAVVYETLRQWPGWWWLASAGALSLGRVALAFLVPVVLIPLFYPVRPLGRPDLEARLQALAARAGATAPRLFRVDLGTRTRKANAALAGIGRSRRILLADRLLDECPDDEIVAIVAHELAHHTHRDIWRGVAVETLVLVAAFFAAHRALAGLGARIGLTAAADVAGLPLLLLAGGAVSLIAAPAVCAFSRATERRADRFALALSGAPRAYASAVRRLAAQNLAELRPSRVVLLLSYTHPPIEERLAMAERAAADQGAGEGP